VTKENTAYSVISANDFNEPPHAFYRDTTEILRGGTASGAEVAKTAGDVPPHRNHFSHPDYESVRKQGVVEKCIFCEHRVKKGELPNCVVACPAKARIFGDLNDGSSEPAGQLKKFKSFRLKEEKKTRPNVSYIRNFKGGKTA
jgi:ferredoxin